MLNRFLLILSMLTFTGCYNGCLSPMPTIACGGPYGKPWPSIAYIQKPETIGHTNSEQRWRDAVACGAEYGDVELRSAMTHDNDGPIDMEMRETFGICMAQKGYIQLSYSIDCGSQDPKEDTGKCNL